MSKPNTKQFVKDKLEKIDLIYSEIQSHLSDRQFGHDYYKDSEEEVINHIVGSSYTNNNYGSEDVNYEALSKRISEMKQKTKKMHPYNLHIPVGEHNIYPSDYIHPNYWAYPCAKAMLCFVIFIVLLFFVIAFVKVWHFI